MSSGCAMTSAADTLKIEWEESVRSPAPPRLRGSRRWCPSRDGAGSASDEFQPSQLRDFDLGRGPGRGDRTYRDLRHRARADRASSARSQGNRDHRSHLARPLRTQYRRRWNSPKFGCSACRSASTISATPTPMSSQPCSAPVDRERSISREFLYRARRLLRPKPLQRPWPLIMSAVQPAGRDSPRAMPI